MYQVRFGFFARLLLVRGWMALLAFPSTVLAQDFRLQDFTMGSDARFRVSYPANTNSYYILYAGHDIANISSPVLLAVGRGPKDQLTIPDPVSSNAMAFYRLRQVPLTDPADTDADGIDDVYEMRRRSFLDPLQAADAALDFDNDGQSNLQEYQGGTDPDEGTSQMRAIAAGGWNTVGLKRDGSLWNWGMQGPGQHTHGAEITLAHPQIIPSPMLVGLAGTQKVWRAVSARDQQSLAISVDGGIFVWGSYLTSTDARALLNDRVWMSAAAGGRHVLALKHDLTVWAWGYNEFGQLGNGTIVRTNVPIQIGVPHDWSAIAAGDSHSVGLKTDGSLWAWGLNSSGQLGNGTNINQTVPIRIGAENDWRSVAAGGTHTIALKRDGSLWAWGDNSVGQLGDGTTINKTSPVRIGAENNWLAIAAGGGPWPPGHTVALKTDGSLWAWGDNTRGQLGDGTTEPRPTPVRIGTDNDWRAISTASSGNAWRFGAGGHTVALKRDGSLWAWGDNDAAQLGLGYDGGFQTAPVRVGSDTDWGISE